MAKTLEQILREGNSKLGPDAIRAIQEQAKRAGLTKRTIHIELDMLTGNMKWTATPMDNLTHLGMIEFYKTAVIAEIMKRPIAKNDETPETEPETPPASTPAPDAPPAEAPAPAADPVPPAAGDAPSEPAAPAAPGQGESEPAAPAADTPPAA